MSVQLEIPLETLTRLIDQLSPEEKQQLREMLETKPELQDDDPAAKMKRLREAMSSLPVIGDFPISREEMYDDDGR